MDPWVSRLHNWVDNRDLSQGRWKEDRVWGSRESDCGCVEVQFPLRHLGMAVSRQVHLQGGGNVRWGCG